MGRQIQRNTGRYSFSSVTNMRAFLGGTGLKDGEYADLNADSNAGGFKWDASSTESDDGIDTIKLTAVATGRFIRRKEYNQGGAGAVDRTQASKNQESVSVKDFGAVGDGVTVDTLSTQAAIDTSASVGGTVLFPPSSSPYVMGKIIIGSSDGLTLDGNGQELDLTGSEAGFWLSGVISNLTIRNFKVTGDGTSTSAQALVQNNSGQTLSRIKVLDNFVTNTRNGIALTAEGGGSIVDVEYSGNYIDTTNGTAGGEGYGLFLSGPNNTSIRGNIHHNWVNGATRHSIYVSRGDDVNISNNIISNHRQGVADLSIRAAIAAVRGSNRIIRSNIFINTFDGCLNINADTSASGAITRNNVVADNTFLPNGNDIAQVYIGSSAPATDDGVLDDIVIFDNKFYPGANTTNAVQFDHGKKILASENKFFIDKAIGYAFQFTAQAESGGSTTHSSGWDLFDNRIELNGATSAAYRSVSPFVSDSSMTARFKRNDIIRNGASSVAFSQSSSVSGPVLEITQMDQSGLVSSSSPTESGVVQFADADPSPSVNNAVMGFTNNTGATTFSGMDDGRIGQRVTVVFSDSNTTVDFTGTSLRGNAGVDWSPATGESMTCDFDGTNWTCTIREI